MTAKMELKWEPWVPEPVCGAVCPRNQYALCELPVDHITGRSVTPQYEHLHFGRDRNDKWWRWAVK